MDGAVSNLLTPLSSGLGSGIEHGGGIGGGIKDVGGGIGSMMEYLLMIAGVGVVGFLLLENSDKKRGRGEYLGPLAKRARSRVKNVLS